MLLSDKSKASADDAISNEKYIAKRSRYNCKPLKDGHCINSLSTPDTPEKIPAVDNSIHTLQDDDTSSNLLSSTLSSTNNEDDSFVPSVDSTLHCDEASGSSDDFSTGESSCLFSNNSTKSHLSSLPNFTPMSDATFLWGTTDSAKFVNDITSCYNEVVHWKRNIFKVPYGNVGDAFVQELARLFQSYADSSCLESIALYAAMTMSALLLKKPIDGDVESLLQEGRVNQSSLKFTNRSNSSNSIAKRFSDLMLIGDVKGAIRLLSNRENGTVLSLETIINDRSVKEILHDKHPNGQPIKPSALVSGPSHSISHPILFDQLTPDLIRATALRS
uniref:Uncharacterized protein n=1 Tax=Amphimedon queenslandica TaxID=400682 RepID=A0A1X7VA35_AMPQE